VRAPNWSRPSATIEGRGEQCRNTPTIREINKVAIGRVVLTNREHIMALAPLDKGLVGTRLRYPYDARAKDEHFDEIQEVKVTKDMLDLGKHGKFRARQVREPVRDDLYRPH
jgi:non-homologous end joining protein Ku